MMRHLACCFLVFFTAACTVDLAGPTENLSIVDTLFARFPDIIAEFELTHYDPPAVYRKWGRELAECGAMSESFELPSGDSATLDDIRWYAVHDPATIDDTYRCARYAYQDERRCRAQFIPWLSVIVSEYRLDVESTIKHEMGHALLQDTTLTHDNMLYCACTGSPWPTYGCYEEYKVAHLLATRSIEPLEILEW